MTALQVRDFPTDLYEQVKESARANHRSIAQETVVLVERGLRSECNDEGFSVKTKQHHNDYGLSFETDAERAARKQKKKEIFAKHDSLPRKEELSTQEIVDLIRESREERTNAILSVLDSLTWEESA